MALENYKKWSFLMIFISITVYITTRKKTSVKIYCKSSVLTLFVKGTMKEREKLPNYFSPKWANHSIYNGLMVVLNVRNMERNYKMSRKQQLFKPLDFTGF